MIDLHCHSTCSDGTLSPRQLAAAGRDFRAFALTDHDNCDGAAEFLAASRGHAGLRLAGVELSVEPGKGFGKFHLLGLGVDPNAPGLDSFLDEIRAGRVERNRQMLRRLAEMGMPVTDEELLKYSNGRLVARPHLARVLIDHGWAKDIKDAFARILGAGCPAYVSRYRPQPEEAIAVIHAAGGVAVMAHPRFWTQDSAQLRSGLRGLMDLGLDGIEAEYRANLPGETVDHLRAARELGLAVTAGSDFHGSNKPDIPLGMQVHDEEEFLAPFLARLNQRRSS